MADDLTTILRFVGDPSNAEAAISGLISSLQKAAQQSQNLFSGLGKEVETSLKPLIDEPKKIPPVMRDAEAATVRLAQAAARLQVAQGDTAKAVTTLKTALSETTKETTTTLNAQRQLVTVQAQAATAAGKAETAMLREAQAIARLQQIAGNTPGAIKTLSDALEKATNKSSLPAIRAELQKTYLDTNYANSPLIGAIRSITQGASALSPQLGATAGQVSNLAAVSAGSAAALVGVGLAIGGIVVAVGAFIAAGTTAVNVLESIGEAGIKTNAQLETIRLGITTVIASVGEIRNSDGLQLKGLDALTAVLPIASDQLRKLRIDALETSATIADIAPAFQAAIGPGLVAGLTIDQIRENTIKLTQAVTALGLPLDQIKQETRAILSGDINRNTQAAVALGITREAALEAQKQGKFAEFLEQKLTAAAAAGKLVAQTFAAAQSNLKEAGDTFSAVVTEGLFNRLRDELNKVLPQIFDKNSATLISKNFEGIADTLTKVFNTAGDRIVQVIELAVEKVKELSAFLDENRAAIDQTIASVDTLLESVIQLGSAIFDAFSPEKKTLVDGIRNAVDTVSLGIAHLQDEVEEIGARVLYFIQAVILGIEGPLSSALNFIGLGMEGLNQDVQRLTNSMGAALNRIAEGAKNTEKIEQRIKSAQQRADNFNAFGKLSKEDRQLASLFLGEDGFNVPKPIASATAASGVSIRGPKRKTDTGSAGASKARQEAAAELKLLQTQEKEAELINKRINEALRASLQDRLISLQTFTQLSIQNDQDLLQKRLAALKAEENAAVRTAKNSTEADAKRADFRLKAATLQQDFDIEIERKRDEQRRTEEKSAIDHENRLVEIRDAARKRAESQIKDAAGLNVIGQVAAEQKLIDIERERLNERQALLQRDLKAAGENLEDRQRINDELVKLEEERATASDEASRRIRDASTRELNDRISFLRNLTGAYGDLGKAQLDQTDAQTALAVQEGRLSQNNAALRDFEQRREALRLETKDRQQSIAEQAAGLAQQAIQAQQGAARLVEIERLKTEALTVERQRAAAIEQQIQNEQLAFLQAIGGGIRGLFSARVNELANNLGLARGLIQNFVTDLQASITPLDEIGSKAFQGFADGIGSAVSNFVLLGRTGPAVIRKLLAAQLAAIAQEAAINAIKELALGFSALFVNPPAAAGHFTSAALWASIAGASAIVGRAIAPKEAGGGAASSASEQTDSSGNRVIEQGGALPTSGGNQITIRVITHPDVTIERVQENVQNNGTLRTTFQQLAGATA